MLVLGATTEVTIETKLTTEEREDFPNRSKATVGDESGDRRAPRSESHIRRTDVQPLMPFEFLQEHSYMKYLPTFETYASYVQRKIHSAFEYAPCCSRKD